jgi:hypothetical protein
MKSFINTPRRVVLRMMEESRVLARAGKKTPRVRQQILSVDQRAKRKTFRRSMRLVHSLVHSLESAFPLVNRRVIGDIVADLDDLWDYGQELDHYLWGLCKMRLPRDRNEMQRALVGIDVQQFDYAKNCIERLHKNLPKLVRYLYQDASKWRQAIRPRARVGNRKK